MEGFVALAPDAVFARDFRVVRPLSSGGMGAVYVVEQLSTGKQRALKLMRPELVENPELRSRFELEARVSAKIESDHVVEVIGAGVDEASGLPWLAMELLSGEPLSDYVARTGPAPLPVVREVAEQLAHAISAAHDKRIVHRDLKPENVFLARPKRTGTPFTVKVLDFGIAKVLADAKTKTTGALGTPLWMAPEQTSPGVDVSPATDVWAFGLVVFWLLTGKSYWRSANVGDCSPVVLLREIVMDDLAPASARAKELGAPALPAGFDEWFAKAVNRDPLARFENAREAHAALAEMLGPPGPFSVSLRPPVHEPIARTLVTTSAVSALARSEGGEASLGRSPASGVSAFQETALATEIEKDLARGASAPSNAARPSRRPAAVVIGSLAVAAIGTSAFVWALTHRAPPSQTAPSASSVASARKPSSGFRVTGQHNLMVLIDGRTAGTTPLDTIIEPGKHHLRFEAGDDYEPREMDVDVGEGQVLALPDVLLKVLRGHLVLEARTPGIDVELEELDGPMVRARQPLPTANLLTRELDATKSWRIVAFKAGYEDFRQDLVFAPGESTLNVKLGLERVDPGSARVKDELGGATMNLTSNPWANVSVDGAALGATPLARVHVTSGTHTIRFSTPGGAEKTMSVTLRAGETKTVDAGFD